jgi:hypothetical protein
MTVKDLKTFLETLPEDMEITETRYSDFGPMELDKWIVCKAIWRVSPYMGKLPYDDSPWLMEVYDYQLSKMSEEDKAKIINVLHYQGN